MSLHRTLGAVICNRLLPAIALSTRFARGMSETGGNGRVALISIKVCEEAGRH
jgi:hypothetical protein